MPARGVPSTGDPALKTRARHTLRSLVAATVAQGRGCEEPNCKYPGVPIDLTAKSGPLRYVLDEILPRYLGGSPVDPDNVRPAHYGCNAAAGARITNAGRRAKAHPPRTANRW